MPKYRCFGRIVATKYMGIVEAENEEEAQKKAWHLPGCGVYLCPNCVDEFEEDPQIITVGVAEIANLK